jgi:DNA repair protein SbcD/Mre11
MRFLHTADWHLGRTLGGHVLIEDQAQILLGQLRAAVRETRPDALLIAGDVFDRAVPPAEAVALLDDVLEAVVLGEDTQVVMIPGNHDDPQRLSFGAKLLRAAGLHIADSPLGLAVPFEDAHGPLGLVAAGYGTPLALAQQAADGSSFADHDAGFAWLAPQLHALCGQARRRVLVAHAFVAGGGESEGSERALSVGGTGQIGAARFAGFDYVALGHLHRPQALAAGRLRYAGSPLAYSTSEAGQAKSFTLVEIGGAGAVRVEEIPIAPPRPLRVLTGSFAALRAAPEEGRGDFVAITLTDPIPVPEAQRRLAEIFPHIVGLRYAAEADGPGAAPTGADGGDAAAARRALRPLDLFAAFHAAQRGAPLPEAARPLVAEAIAAAEDS